MSKTGRVESEIMLFRALLQLNTQDTTDFLLVCVYGSETINRNGTLSAQSNTALYVCSIIICTQTADYVGIRVLTGMVVKNIHVPYENAASIIRVEEQEYVELE